MLDTTPQSPRWQDALQLGDVILYRTDTPNARPNRHLVCDLATVKGKRWAALCAASDLKPPLPFRLGAEQPDGLALFDRTSLPGFFASKPRWVDLDDPGFTFDAAVGSPVVGMLTRDGLERLLAVRRAATDYTRIIDSGRTGTWLMSCPDPHSDRDLTLKITCRSNPGTSKSVH